MGASLCVLYLLQYTFRENARAFPPAHFYVVHPGSSVRNITVDITVFPRQELLLLLRLVDSLQGRIVARLLYSEPAHYSTEDAGGWLTRGVRSVRSVVGFGGIQSPGKKCLLVLFLGHEDERATITWRRYQPNLTIVFLPGPNYRGDLNGIARRMHELWLTKFDRVMVAEEPLPARGPSEAAEALLGLWQKYHGTHNIVAAPLGTKLQTLGVYVAVRERPEIQIAYAVPSIYNYDSYSSGVGPLWSIQWPISPVPNAHAATGGRL